jgi:hypothetical protein
MFEGQHENLHLEMEGLDPAIAQQLERMKQKALLSDVKEQRSLIPTRSKSKPKTNTDLPKYEGKLANI